MRDFTPQLSAAAAGLLVTGAAFAGIDSTPAFPVSIAESQLDGYDFEFTIHNCDDDAEITGIYFENGWEDFFSDDLFDRNLRVDPGPLNFLEGTDNPALDPWTSSTVSYEVPGGSGLSGVGSGGSATIAFVNNGFSDFSVEDLEAVMGTDGFGIGLQILGLADGPIFQFAELGEHDCDFDFDDDGDDGEGSGDDGGEGGGGGDGATGIPSPSAALMGLALIGLVGQRRRRGL